MDLIDRKEKMTTDAAGFQKGYGREKRHAYDSLINLREGSQGKSNL